jgi:hypothetical protein
MARKKKQEKVEVKFSKFLPGESTWKERKNKTRQDRQPAAQRERVHEWHDRLAAAAKK